MIHTKRANLQNIHCPPNNASKILTYINRTFSVPFRVISLWKIAAASFYYKETLKKINSETRSCKAVNIGNGQKTVPIGVKSTKCVRSER